MSEVRLLRITEVMHTVGLSRSTIYLRISQGTFPAPVKIGERAVGWSSQDIQRWIEQRLCAMRAAA